MASQMKSLGDFILDSEQKVSAQILGTYSVLKEEFKLVESRRKRSQAHHDLIDNYHKQQGKIADGVCQKKYTVRVNVGGEVHIIKRSTMLSSGQDMNFLFLILSGRWDYLLPRDRNNVIFIDLDPAIIEPIFHNLRYRSAFGSDAISKPRISIDQVASFNEALLYYNLKGLFHCGINLSEKSKIE